MTDSASRLEVQSLVAGYGREKVLRGVSARAERGQLLALLGPNGAGKSTFLKACLGLLPVREGTVHLLGRPLSSWSRAELAKVTAWVPQHFDVASGFTALEVSLMGRSPHLGLWGLPSNADAARATAVLEELSAGQLLARPVSELSGGEQRLVWLARALVQAPSILFLDEPTAFLDLRHQVEVLEKLRARTANGLTVVAVLHDVNLAAAFADRVLLMKDGVALAQGLPKDVLTAEGLEGLYGVRMGQVRLESGQSVFAPLRN